MTEAKIAEMSDVAALQEAGMVWLKTNQVLQKALGWTQDRCGALQAVLVKHALTIEPFSTLEKLETAQTRAAELEKQLAVLAEAIARRREARTRDEINSAIANLEVVTRDLPAAVIAERERVADLEKQLVEARANARTPGCIDVCELCGRVPKGNGHCHYLAGSTHAQRLLREHCPIRTVTGRAEK